MSVRTNGASAVQAAGQELPLLSAIVLTRICCGGGSTRADLMRDLGPLFTGKLSPAEWRRTAEAAVVGLLTEGLVSERRSKLTATEAGADAVTRFAGASAATSAWTDVRNTTLVARALGLAGDNAQRKALTRPAGLRSLILQSHFALPARAGQSPVRLRSALAVVALERAFGNKIKSELGSHAGLSAKAARLLAGQLASKPRDFGTDARLISALAAEAAGAAQPDEESLRLALLRRLAARALGLGETSSRAAPAAPPARLHPLPRAANDTAPATVQPAAAKPAEVRPDLTQFSTDVIEAARTRAEGWPGNRKAFISHVWQAIRARRPEWVLSEIEFKCMLAEAHRSGRVVLANADLKDKKSLKELRESAVAYKNTVWHFVRVED